MNSGREVKVSGTFVKPSFRVDHCAHIGQSVFKPFFSPFHRSKVPIREVSGLWVARAVGVKCKVAHPVFAYFLGKRRNQRPGALSPGPWHFSLFASSMAVGWPPSRKIGFATARAGWRGDERGLLHPATRRSFLAVLMLLAQSGKCRGAGGRAPTAQGSRQKPDEPNFLKILVKCIDRYLAMHYSCRHER